MTQKRISTLKMSQLALARSRELVNLRRGIMMKIANSGMGKWNFSRMLPHSLNWNIFSRSNILFSIVRLQS